MFNFILFLILFFFISPLATLCWLYNHKLKVVISFGITPAFMGWLIHQFFLFFPAKPENFYLNILIIIQSFWILITILKFKKQILFELKNREIWYFIGTYLFLFFVALRLPVYEADTLEYLILAKKILLEKSFSSYPITFADDLTGFYTPMRHPLGYINIIIIGLLFGASPFLVIKTISSFYFSALILCMKIIIRKKTILYIFSTPLFIYIFATFQIDIYRIFLFVLSVICISNFFENPSKKIDIFLSGLIVGFSMDSHSLGLFSFALLGTGLYFIPFSHYLSLCISSSIAIFLGGSAYISNMIEMGKIVSDANIVWSLPKINEGLDLITRRNIVTAFHWVIFGFLQGFSKIHFFGINFYQAIYVFIMNKHKNYSYLWRVSAIGICLFYIVVLISGDLGIKNPRYFLTILPLTIFIYYQFPFKLRKTIFFIKLFLLIYSLFIFKSLGFSINNNFFDFENHKSYEFFNKLKELKIIGPVLAFEQSLFLTYSNVMIVRDLNPVLLDFYNADNIDAALKELKKLGINYVYLPNFMPATFYNSFIMEILSDSNISEIVLSKNGFRLFRIKQNFNKKREFKLIDFCVSKREESNFFEKLIWGRLFTVELSCKQVSKDDIVKVDLTTFGSGSVEILMNDIQYARSVFLNEKTLKVQIKPEMIPFKLNIIFYGKIKKYDLNGLLIKNR